MKKPEPSSFPPETSSSSTRRRLKFGQILLQSSDHHLKNEDDDNLSSSSSSSTTTSSHRRPSSSDFPTQYSPANYVDTPSPSSSPWTTSANQTPSVTYSPYTKSPWTLLSPAINQINPNNNNTQLIGSLIREQGHVYSLAISSHFLYTGSDSKNIRIWSKSHNLSSSSGFKSTSGLVKSIIITTNYIFTAHQDGKIRIWRQPPQPHNSHHRRVGSLPKWTDTMWSWMSRPAGTGRILQVRRNGKRVPVIRHYDAVSCMSFDEELGLLYSGSWDKTIKVWRIKDFKCLESITAHSDAVNAVVVGFNGLIFSGSADGTIKVWRREQQHGSNTRRHVYVQTLLEQKSAVTSLAVSTTLTTTTTAGNEEDVSGNVVYGGTSDGLVSFWDWDEQLTYGGVLSGHNKKAVLCLSTAGCLVLSGSADNSICIWKREGGVVSVGGGSVHSCMAVLSGHGGPVKCLAVEEEEEIEEDGDGVIGRCWRVYSGSLDKSVKVWRVREDGKVIRSTLPEEVT